MRQDVLLRCPHGAQDGRSPVKRWSVKKSSGPVLSEGHMGPERATGRWECECSLRWMHGVHDGTRAVTVCVKGSHGAQGHMLCTSPSLWAARAFLPQKVPWVLPTSQVQGVLGAPASPAPSPSGALTALSCRSPRVSHP